MTKQIKLLSVAGLVSILVAGFGIFAATQMNEAPENTNTSTEISEAGEESEGTLTPKDKKQKEVDVETEGVAEAVQTSQSVEAESTDSREESRQNSMENFKNYTNEFFPNLSLEYPSSWNIEVEESSKFDQPSYNIRVKTREADRLDFVLSPTVARGCDNQENRAFSREVAPALYEFKDKNSFTYYYSKNKDLNNCVVKSDIESIVPSTSGAVVANNQGNSLYTLSISGQFTPDLASEVTAILESAMVVEK